MDAHKRMDGEQPEPKIDGGLVAEALDVLTDVLAWRHIPERWRQVAVIIESMAAALAGGDEEAVRRATLDLELVSPSRATKPGDQPTVEAPAPIQATTNRLISRLAGAAGDTPAKGERDRPTGT